MSHQQTESWHAITLIQFRKDGDNLFFLSLGRLQGTLLHHVLLQQMLILELLPDSLSIPPVCVCVCVCVRERESQSLKHPGTYTHRFLLFSSCSGLLCLFRNTSSLMSYVTNQNTPFDKQTNVQLHVLTSVMVEFLVEVVDTFSTLQDGTWKRERHRERHTERERQRDRDSQRQRQSSTKMPSLTLCKVWDKSFTTNLC